MKASVNKITGVMCSTASLPAQKAASKQSVGVQAAKTTAGHSPLRPYKACNKSVCSDLVGIPVDGPPRCTSMTTRGTSAITAKPMASLFRARPGPEVEVAARQPAKLAPIAVQTPAISSSACTVITPKSLRLDNSCKISVAGVIG